MMQLLLQQRSIVCKALANKGKMLCPGAVLHAADNQIEIIPFRYIK
jgi:hypothetical protein